MPAQNLLRDMTTVVIDVVLNVRLDKPATSASCVAHGTDLLRLYTEIEALGDKIKLLTDGLVAEQSNLERVREQRSIVEGLSAVIGGDYDYGDGGAGIFVTEDEDELEAAIASRQKDIAELRARLSHIVTEFTRLRGHYKRDVPRNDRIY
ncbi:hypothetical protein CPBP_01136 [Candidatus Bodocaedibacter vickermanii]|uniref:Uncharacterized protein n=2 Tax=Candidatus Bodocaedibacter vickermanii TaxID=2741701 RepID=A0A7L9RUU8_9PROT|nr:hypothetical protein CPBP_01136 [Candidatus Paracaedibacteraceae bacterium 'Lake Konstanz']